MGGLCCRFNPVFDRRPSDTSCQYDAVGCLMDCGHSGYQRRSQFLCLSIPNVYHGGYTCEGCTDKMKIKDKK